jgi:hypothetical protein
MANENIETIAIEGENSSETAAKPATSINRLLYPICCVCNKMRAGDEERWVEMPDFFIKYLHSMPHDHDEGATHTYCPEHEEEMRRQIKAYKYARRNGGKNGN